jgi:hypothetical protein
VFKAVLHFFTAMNLYGRQLEKVTGEDELEASEREIRSTTGTTPNLVQDLKDFGGHHTHLINNQDLRGLPISYLVLIGANFANNLYRCTRGQADACPRMNSFCVTVEEQGCATRQSADLDTLLIGFRMFHHQLDKSALARATGACEKNILPRFEKRQGRFLFGR